MAIQVTCPGCLKRFQVNEKFAGKTGPCPNCSKPIKIPDKSEEVVIHAPESEGPKDAKGRPVFKPIRRTEVKLSLPVMLGVGGGVLVCLIVALAVRLGMSEPPVPLLVLGTILLAPPLSFGGYWFLHDDELEGYSGKELLVRGGIASLAFIVTWVLYWLIPLYVLGHNSLAELSSIEMVLIIPVMVILGTLVSLAALELEFGQALLHYFLYFAVTVTLALVMGAELAEPLAKTKKPATPAANVQDAKTDGNKTDTNKQSPPPTTPESGEKKKPNLMQ
ncbi:MAG: hypothetical protein U0892_17530 [Pirellulales bacterium]